MDRTTVMVGDKARQRLADYRDANDHPNYDVALRDLLDQVEAEA